MDNDELLERATFGKEVEAFWGSRLGGYLQARAKECYTTAIQGLKTVDPSDARAIIKLQADAFKAESFEQWLTEAMIDGFKSLEILEGEYNE